MRLLIAVPPKRVSSVLEAARENGMEVVRCSLREMYVALRTSVVDVVVVDPMLDASVNQDALVQVVRSYPSLSWLVFTPLRPDVGQLVVELSRAGVRRVILAGLDDSDTLLRSALRDIDQQLATQRATARILSLVAPLPRTIRNVLKLSMEEGAELLDVTRFALNSQMSRRTLERHFLQRDLPKPKTILFAIRMLKAFQLLNDGTIPYSVVAKTLGYKKPSTLRAQVKRFFGVRSLTGQGELLPEAAVIKLLYPRNSLATVEPRKSPRLVRTSSVSRRRNESASGETGGRR
jgi:AraC-like DNA-binding protein